MTLVKSRFSTDASAQPGADSGRRRWLAGTARAVAHTLQGYYASLHTHQTTAPFKDRMMDFDGLNALIGTPELMAQGRQYE